MYPFDEVYLERIVMTDSFFRTLLTFAKVYGSSPSAPTGQPSLLGLPQAQVVEDQAFIRAYGAFNTTASLVAMGLQQGLLTPEQGETVIQLAGKQAATACIPSLKARQALERAQGLPRV
jgi:hypothetical protein